LFPVHAVDGLPVSPRTVVFLSQRNSGVVLGVAHFPSSMHASYSRTATSYLSIQNWSIKTSRCAERDEGEQGGESLHLIDLENRAAKPLRGLGRCMRL